MVAAAAVAGPAMFVVGAFLFPGSSTDTVVPFDNPLGQPGLLGEVAKGLVASGLALHVASLPAALLCVILRFRASRGVERQQLRWVAAGAAIAVVTVSVPLGDLAGALGRPAGDPVRAGDRGRCRAALPALGPGPPGQPDGHLRGGHRGPAVVPYLLVVPAASELVEGSGSLAVAGATLAVAALFQPVRRRVQDLVDRRFNRRRYDAARTVDGFAPAPPRPGRPGRAAR